MAAAFKTKRNEMKSILTSHKFLLRSPKVECCRLIINVVNGDLKPNQIHETTTIQRLQCKMKSNGENSNKKKNETSDRELNCSENNKRQFFSAYFVILFLFLLQYWLLLPFLLESFETKKSFNCVHQKNEERE